MKHAVIINETEKTEKCVRAEKCPDNTVWLAEAEYSPEELEQFNCERTKWILKCKGSQQFTADSDSGEDAYGYYCRYFDLIPEKAVFENGKLVGVYLCNYSISYSGNGRYDFSIDDWGFPGSDPFRFIPWGEKTHVFLFADAKTHKWKDWTLLEKDHEARYESYLKF